MAKNDEAAQAAQQTRIPDTPAAEPAAQTAEPAPQEPVKVDKRKKDPSQPVVVPFQLITAENRARLAAIGKANDETLSKLLSAYENQSATADQQSQSIIDRLQEENKRLRVTVGEKHDATVQLTAKVLKLQETIDTLKAEISAKDQEIAAKVQEIAEKDAKIAGQNQRISELEVAASVETDTEIQAKLQQLTDRATKAEDEVKDNRQLIDGLNAAKRELEKQLKQAQKDLESTRNAYLDVKRNGGDALPLNHYPEGDILHFFPTITARMIERTAEKLTACRTDGITVTPAMIVGDMFNRYTIEQWNLWFFKWVLSESEMLEIAQEVEPKITSMRMLKAALNIH